MYGMFETLVKEMLKSIKEFLGIEDGEDSDAA